MVWAVKVHFLPPSTRKLVLVLGLALIGGQGFATKTRSPDAFNAIGPLYPVIEQDLLEHIEGEIASQELSGELGAKLDEARQRAIAYVNEPPAVKGLRVAKHSSSYLFDPSVTLQADVINAEGNILHPAGTKVNPLEHVTIDQGLLFFDESDVIQQRIALRLLQGSKPPVAILVGGSPVRFAKQSGVRTYFDQAGAISQRLKLTRVPALVSQQGNNLRIDILGSSN